MTSALKPAVRTALKTIDAGLHELWDLGRNTVIGWRFEGHRIEVLAAPTNSVIAAYDQFPRVFRGRRLLGKGVFSQVSRYLAVDPAVFFVQAMIGRGTWDIDPGTIENLVRRYAISVTQHRAVMLFDIVGFTRFSPLEQLAQLNSLELAINLATKRLADVGVRTDLARSTTGDGFYVWNRAKGYRHDTNTLAAFMLIVAQNAIDRQRMGGRTVPTLRAAFSIGSHFSYHQVEAMAPRGYEYIVGDVTIKLARSLQSAVSGQILVGNFNRPLTDGPDQPSVDAIMFLAAAEQQIMKLCDSQIDNVRIGTIRMYFTGSECESGGYNITNYQIEDKHGMVHSAFNLKINIHRPDAPSIFLGKRDCELGEFKAMVSRYFLNLSQS